MEHLEQCRERIRHAKAHLEALDREWSSLLANFEYTIEHDPATGWHRVVTKYFQPPSLSLGLIASDYIHQLRSTLDNLVCALAERNGTKRGGAHAFPVTREKAKWQNDASRMLKGLRPDQIGEISALQPFTADDPDKHPIAVLHDLSRYDKHRLLTPTSISLTDKQPALVVDQRGHGIEIKEFDFEPRAPLEAGRAVVGVRIEPADADTHVDLDGAFPVYLTIGALPISDAGLERIGMCVEDIVNRTAFQ